MTARFGRAPLALIVASGLVVATAWPLARTHWETLLEHGVEFGSRKQIQRFLKAERREARLVMGIGDSTLRPPIPFTTQAGARIGPSVEVRTFWGAGLSPAEAALMSAAALELEPDVIVLLANFGTFRAPMPLRYPQLARRVPLRRLPDLVGLPLASRGMGAGELVFRSLAGGLVPRDWLTALIGGSRWPQDVLEARYRVMPGEDWHRLERMSGLRRESILTAGDNVYPGNPSIEILRGNVAMIEGAGAEALVVVSPINVAPLVEHGVFDAEVLKRRVQVVVDAVESAGGDVIDVHDALPPEEFADEVGHYTSTGSRRISLRVEDWLRSELGLPARAKK